MSETEPHLLVVDDDLRLRELLRRYLSDSGFRVTGAADAAEARAQLASFAFDLVVLDVMMPGESGLVLTRALRDRAAQRIPVLLLTAMGEPEDRVNGLEQGADDYLAKPFEPRELVLRIRNILQRRPEPAEAAGEARFGAFPERAGQDEPAFAGHHHIEHDEVKGKAGELGARLHRVGRPGHAKAAVGQVAPQQLAQPQIVVDDEKMGLGFAHRRRLYSKKLSLPHRGRGFTAAPAAAGRSGGGPPRRR